MHTQSIEEWRHDHVFLGAHHADRERRIWLVVGLTAVMMVVEIVGGTIYGSMALIADGWHMSTHAAALSIAALAYAFARRHASNPRFSFGTGKVGDLAGFASAIILALVALMIGYESVTRIIRPVAIDYNEALLIAALGLAVNLASAWLSWAMTIMGTRMTRSTPITTATTITAPPICTCWRMRSPRSWRSPDCLRRGFSPGRGSTRWWGCSAVW